MKKLILLIALLFNTLSYANEEILPASASLSWSYEGEVSRFEFDVMYLYSPTPGSQPKMQSAGLVHADPGITQYTRLISDIFENINHYGKYCIFITAIDRDGNRSPTSEPIVVSYHQSIPAEVPKPDLVTK